MKNAAGAWSVLVMFCVDDVMWLSEAGYTQSLSGHPWYTFKVLRLFRKVYGVAAVL